MVQAKKSRIEGSGQKTEGSGQRKEVCGSALVGNYQILGEIGGGNNGKVFLGLCQTTEKKFVLKQITLKRRSDGIPITFIREIQVLRKIDHPNLIELKEVILGEEEKVANLEAKEFKIYLVFPYLGKDLLVIIKKGVLSQKLVSSYCRQILCGIEYLHRESILHRDIKPANILVSRSSEVKIIDFGLSREYVAGDMSQGVVTRWYRPPELLFNVSRYTTAIDMWSFGCVMGEMVLGRPLFPAKTEGSQLLMIAKMCGEIDSKVFEAYKLGVGFINRVIGQGCVSQIMAEFGCYSRSFAQLLARCLEIDPLKRCTASEALAFLDIQAITPT
ncbi:cyclin-dependent kinase 12/13 [Nematocida displodere]|uniref:Cyclin-dependent kinase 12/13 n=1 Tax=Nematocida displodere TaxID=1805483 RepID=A0A177ECM0_9MICR|nr:cyclin-dependent kinase 12/13 [Nematocida displodere]